jgi:hypothetical protein
VKFAPEKFDLKTSPPLRLDISVSIWNLVGTPIKGVPFRSSKEVDLPFRSWVKFSTGIHCSIVAAVVGVVV